MDDDPIALFLAGRAAARAAGAPFEGTAAALATATPDGAPSLRMVLVKEVGPDGFFLYTNYESQKGRELAENPRAALTAYWPEIGEQFRVVGAVERATDARSDAYFDARPRESQIGAWASAQSRPIASREALMEQTRALEARFEGRPVPRPPHWGGYRLVPARIERWMEGAARLHDRFAYDRAGDGWSVTRLAP